MSFHLSAEDIRIDDNHILRARLRTEGGDWNDSEFDLNTVLGNQDGMIHWDGRGTYLRKNPRQPPRHRQCHL